jgi:hypothetical protein
VASRYTPPLLNSLGRWPFISRGIQPRVDEAEGVAGFRLSRSPVDGSGMDSRWSWGRRRVRDRHRRQRRRQCLWSHHDCGIDDGHLSDRLLPRSIPDRGPAWKVLPLSTSRNLLSGNSKFAVNLLSLSPEGLAISCTARHGTRYSTRIYPAPDQTSIRTVSFNPEVFSFCI